MAAHPNPVLMTVEEYYDLPTRDDVILELHWGRLVEWSRPKYWHVMLQKRIAALLAERSGPDWPVVIELPFRAVPQYELRAVDVGVVAKSREDAVGEGDLAGSPEIVIEIMSPSNRRRDLVDKMALFLTAGTHQFCLIDRARRAVSVTGLDSKTIAYGLGEEVPFPLLGASLSVDEIFA